MSKEEQAGLARVLLRRPEWRGRLSEIISSDQRLKDICGDYAAAWRGLEHWRDDPGPEGETHVAEYEEIIAGLEDEIEHHMRPTVLSGSSKI